MRRSRYVLVSLVPFLILVGLFAGNRVADLLRQQAQFRERQRPLSETIAELDATDPGWRWADRIARPSDLPDDRDFLDRLRKLNKNLFEDLFDDARVLPNQLRELTEATARKQAQPVIAEMRSLAGGLTKIPTGFFPRRAGASPLYPDFFYGPEFSKAIRLLKDQVEWLAREGRPAEAMPLIRALLVISETPDDFTSLIGCADRSQIRNGIVRSIERVLGLTEPGEELGHLEEPLLRAARGDLLERTVRNERARRDGIFCLAAESPDTFRESLPAPVQKSTGERNIARMIQDCTLLLPQAHASEVRKWTAILKTFNLPLHERIAAVRKIEAEWPPHDPLLERLLPLSGGIVNNTIEVAVVNEQLSVATFDCARVAIACERFRHRQKRWPRTLSELPPDLLPEIPIDPFDGKPLRYRILPDGIAVWSVDDEEDGAPPELSGGKRVLNSTIFRVWNPDQRRLPAPPPRPEMLPEPAELPGEGPKEKD